MKNLLKVTILLTLAFTTACLVHAENYYLDSLQGDDTANTGHTEQQAWKTISKINAQQLQPGDTVYFKRGGLWRETLVIPSSGTKDQAITFTAYGDGDLPIISGADAVPALALTATPGVWSAALASEPTQVLINGKRGLRVATAAEVNAEGRWQWAGNVLTVFSAKAPAPPVVEASERAYCVEVHVDNIKLENLTLQRAAVCCITQAANSGLTVLRCRMLDGFVFGLHSGYEEAHDRGRILGCEIARCGGCGIQFAGQMNDWIIGDNHIHHCCQLHEGQVGAYKNPGDGSRWQEWSAGIKYWGFYRKGYLGAMIIERNIIEDCGPQFDAGKDPANRSCGIWFDESVDPLSRTIVRRNLVRRNQGKGIFLEKSDNCDVYSNLCYNNASLFATANLMVESNFGEPCRGNRIYNNTCSGGSWAMGLNCYQGKDLTDNDFKNNIAISPSNSLYVATDASDDGTHSKNNTFSHNCFGPATGNAIFVWGGKVQRTYADWEAAYGGATASVQSDPLFVDTKHDDYHLSPTSPCRNAGIALPDITMVDFDGIPFDPKTPNVGAYAK